jgi:hypothetical protein
MTNNWANFLKNLGEWQGSFTQISPEGKLLDSTPSLLSLTSAEDDRLVRFRLRRFETGGEDRPPISDHQQEYRSVGGQAIFFDTGAFSKGSLQVSPVSEFGAEYGFVAENRRSRFVQVYNLQGNLQDLILIREFRMGTEAQERPPLSVEQLLGTWTGTARTAYPDWREPEINSTSLKIDRIDGDRLQQQLSFGDRTITSIANIDGNKLNFEAGSSPRKILLLPDGVSSNTPLKVNHRESFFVEVGWLLADNQRQRLIRNYNDKGEWTSSTHVIEHRV